MEKKCPNCNSTIISKEINPHLVETFELFYGEYWDTEIQDIAMEICPVCGTLPELLAYVEKQLTTGKRKNYKNIIDEFDDNLHVPFLLQIAAPVFIFIVENSPATVQKAAIDELGNYGDEDSLGRFILAHENQNIRIYGLRALERIAKYEKKQGRKLDWNEYLDYIIGDDPVLILKMKKKIKSRNFLKKTTVEELTPLLTMKEEKLTKKISTK